MKSKPPRKLGDIISSILSERGYLVPCLEIEVVGKWPSIVGETIARVTQCTEARDGLLYVKVSSSAWRQELMFVKQEILKKIKQTTRCSTIRDILFY
jgi:predicted nucleic acid-binding Zn ribbon protein